MLPLQKLFSLLTHSFPKPKQQGQRERAPQTKSLLISTTLQFISKTQKQRKQEATQHNTISMATSYSVSQLMVLVICATLLISPPPTVKAGGGVELGLGWVTSKANTCEGSIADCMLQGEEFEMDNEINRRILATNQYISYGALQRNTVPCSRRGASYYNCRPGAQANPYRRGCSAIARCRS